MSHLVVFDTNILVSYLLPSTKVSAVKIAVRQMTSGKATPVFSNAIMTEYEDVLNRKKFHFPENEVRILIDLVLKNGLYILSRPTSAQFTDTSDKPFYYAAVTTGAWLVTGNKRHFPDESFIVSPSEWLERMED